MADTTIQQWGNSLGVRIPKALADQLGFQKGQKVRLELENNKLSIEKPQYTLEGLVSQITPENSHTEIDWGQEIGNEVVEW